MDSGWTTDGFLVMFLFTTDMCNIDLLLAVAQYVRISHAFPIFVIGSNVRNQA